MSHQGSTPPPPIENDKKRKSVEALREAWQHKTQDEQVRSRGIQTSEEDHQSKDKEAALHTEVKFLKEQLGKERMRFHGVESKLLKAENIAEQKAHFQKLVDNDSAREKEYLASLNQKLVDETKWQTKKIIVLEERLRKAAALNASDQKMYKSALVDQSRRILSLLQQTKKQAATIEKLLNGHRDQTAALKAANNSADGPMGADCPNGFQVSGPASSVMHPPAAAQHVLPGFRQKADLHAPVERRQLPPGGSRLQVQIQPPQRNVLPSTVREDRQSDGLQESSLIQQLQLHADALSQQSGSPLLLQQHEGSKEETIDIKDIFEFIVSGLKFIMEAKLRYDESVQKDAVASRVAESIHSAGPSSKGESLHHQATVPISTATLPEVNRIAEGRSILAEIEQFRSQLSSRRQKGQKLDAVSITALLISSKSPRLSLDGTGASTDSASGTPLSTTGSTNNTVASGGSNTGSLEGAESGSSEQSQVPPTHPSPTGQTAAGIPPLPAIPEHHQAAHERLDPTFP